MYSAPSSKIIISMDSPWLELSNGILFVIFRYRLTHFPFSVLIMLENRVQQMGLQLQQEERNFCPVGPKGSGRK